MKRIFIDERESASRKVIERTGNQLTTSWFVCGDEMDSETEDYETSEECDLAIDEFVASVIDEGYVEKEQKSKKQLLRDIETTGNFKVAARYHEFVMNDEKEKYSGYALPSDEVLGWKPGGYLNLMFLDADYDLFDELDIALSSRKQGYVPLARIENEIDFFAVKVDVPECPILYWNHETGEFCPNMDSLDIFLNNLIFPLFLYTTL